MTRTPEERERMHQLLYDADSNTPPWWRDITPTMREFVGRRLDRLLAAFPQLWDSLPPDPAEQARREAEEDWAMLEAMRRDSTSTDLPPVAKRMAEYGVRIADRMAARAAAGHPVLIAPKGER